MIVNLEKKQVVVRNFEPRLPKKEQGFASKRDTRLFAILSVLNKNVTRLQNNYRIRSLIHQTNKTINRIEVDGVALRQAICGESTVHQAKTCRLPPPFLLNSDPQHHAGPFNLLLLLQNHPQRDIIYS
jgi:hypothetical protein